MPQIDIRIRLMWATDAFWLLCDKLVLVLAILLPSYVSRLSHIIQPNKHLMFSINGNWQLTPHKNENICPNVIRIAAMKMESR